MTFKHTKFEDSVTMRSLERIAIQHGLVASEPLTKTASSEKEDFTPSQNLMENVIKLCAGLRNLGFEKHANELESKFVVYKRAFNAYETSKETGDDLVDSAHPDGSPTLVGVEGDAVIETILDQHLKNIKIVEKTPNGKLSSAKDIVRAVKLVLAQDVAVVQRVYQDLKITVNNMLQVIDNLGFIDKLSNKGAITDLLSLIKKYDGGGSEPLTNTAVSIIKIQLDTAYNTVNPHRGAGIQLPGGMTAPLSVSLSVWEQLEPLFTKAYNDIGILLYQTSGKVPYNSGTINKPVPTPTNVTSFDDQLKNVLVILSRWAGVINSDPENTEADKKVALSWINSKSSQVKNLKQVLDNTEDKEQIVPLLVKNLEKIKSFKPDPKTLNFDEFQKEWIG